MNPLDFVPRIVLVAIAVALGALSFWLYLDNSHLKVVAADANTVAANCAADHERLVAKAAQDRVDQLAMFRDTEHALQTQMDNQRKALNAKISATDSAAAALKLRLAEAHIALPNTGGNGQSATPSTTGQTAAGSNNPVLPDPVGGLVDEARRAELIRLNLLACYSAYDAGVALGQ
jgi:hypothetical protein